MGLRCVCHLRGWLSNLFPPPCTLEKLDFWVIFHVFCYNHQWLKARPEGASHFERSEEYSKGLRSGLGAQPPNKKHGCKSIVQRRMLFLNIYTHSLSICSITIFTKMKINNIVLVLKMSFNLIKVHEFIYLKQFSRIRLKLYTTSGSHVSIGGC